MINSIFSKQLAVHLLIGIGTIFTSIGYLVFYSSSGFYSAAPGEFLIGFAVTFANTGYLTFYQNHVLVKMMGRFERIFSVMEAGFIVAVTVLIGLAAELNFDPSSGVNRISCLLFIRVIGIESCIRCKTAGIF